MGVKAAGGVRDLEQVKAMVAAGATRIGASAGVRIVKESRGETTPTGEGERLLNDEPSAPSNLRSPARSSPSP